MTQTATSSTIDYYRLLRFSCFGVGVAAMNWLFYVHLFVSWVPQSVIFSNLPRAQKFAKLKTLEGWSIVLKQVALDNFFYTPLIFFPVFYAMKLVLEGGQDLMTLIPDALSKYSEGGIQDNLISWAIWIPGDTTVFLAPAWLRMPTMQLFSFTLCAALSFLRGEKDAAAALPTRCPSYFIPSQ